MSEAIIQKEEVPKVKSSPKDVFMHLLMIAMLYAGTFSFISLWFDYINYLFPDTLSYYYQGIVSGALVATATLVVVFPVFFLLSWLLGKEMIEEPEKRELRVRKWLVYLTLFLAAVIIIIDTVTLVYFFLNGESTARFFLKVFVVLITAALVFGYYIWDVKRKAGEKSNLSKSLAYGVAAVLIASVSYGFFLFGSPAHQRAVRMDEQRIMDLQNIQSQMITYWQQKEVLPTKIADLTDNISGFIPPTDPETYAEYEYVIKSPLSFELCATFKAKSEDVSLNVRYPVPTSAPVGKTGNTIQDTWSHAAGHVCFERNIDVALYKINKPIPVIVQ